MFDASTSLRAREEIDPAGDIRGAHADQRLSQQNGGFGIIVVGKISEEVIVLVENRARFAHPARVDRHHEVALVNQQLGGFGGSPVCHRHPHK